MVLLASSAASCARAARLGSRALALRPPSQRSGDSGTYEMGLAESTESELATISSDVAKNKSTVIDALLMSVTEVATVG